MLSQQVRPVTARPTHPEQLTLLGDGQPKELAEQQPPHGLVGDLWVLGRGSLDQVEQHPDRRMVDQSAVTGVVSQPPTLESP